MLHQQIVEPEKADRGCVRARKEDDIGLGQDLFPVEFGTGF